ncbi:MAG: shikimate kinase [Gemmatimonadota bacterium]|nr:shikimate kinase [Gemmatimonadota bacterium]
MAERPDSLWLVGLSGSGKSTVGPPLARRLGYDFLDLDDRVEELAGLTVEEIFAMEGERVFRALEAEASREAMARSAVVVATGGGWMARTDLERTRRGCMRLWLRVRPETAIHRLSGSGAGSRRRPLLAGSDPEGKLRRLLALREPAYAEAELHVNTEGREPEDVVSRIIERIGDGPKRSAEEREIERES